MQPTPAPVTSSIIPGSAEDFRVNVGDTVHFALNQYNIEDSDKAVLGRQAAWLAKYPSVRVTIEGHADERGTREYNLALGARRANAVKEYLVSQGVSTGRRRDHLLWQGASDLHRLQRGVLGAEPPWRDHHHRRRQFVTCFHLEKGRGIKPAPLFASKARRRSAHDQAATSGFGSGLRHGAAPLSAERPDLRSQRRGEGARGRPGSGHQGPAGPDPGSRTRASRAWKTRCRA